MVSSVDHLASGAGVAVIRAGGSAADAAIATSAVLAVTTQHMCGMGGDLFALVHQPGDEAPAVLNASGRAGSGADPDRLRAEGHARMPRRDDIRCVPVPGCVDGWLALHERFGRLPLVDVLAPARAYAADGFPCSTTLAFSARRSAIESIPEAVEFLVDGRSPHPGELIRRPGVARALDAIVEHGRHGWYEGEFGEGLLALGAGEYAEDDLRQPLADWVDGLSIEAWGRRLWTIPPNSQGYLTLAGSWIASGLDDLPTDAGDGLFAHYLVESARVAAFDREAVLHEHADGAALLDESRLAPRRAAIGADAALDLPGRFDDGGTIYLCAVDGDGMGVSLIQSNYAGFGSMLVVPGVRVFLQNRGAGFSLIEGHPAEYGPGRRPPHTLSPALVTSPDGRDLDCVIGSMGGDTQPQILLQLLARRYHCGEDVGDVIAAPRFALASEESTSMDIWADRGRVVVTLEDTAPASWFEGLQRRGHEVVSRPAWGGDYGHAHLIAALAGGGLAGAADPRSLGGVATGF